MNKYAIVGATLAAGVLMAGAAEVTSAQAASTGPTAGHPRQVVLVLVTHDTKNTDIDLGKPGFSAGDQQLFTSDVIRDGHRAGTSSGVAQIVATTAKTLTAQATTTTVLAEGTLTAQLAFTEILADGPPAALYAAVTGGTGIYRDARGQCVSRAIDGGNESRLTCQLTLG